MSSGVHPDRLTIIGDLHLSAGRSDDFREDSALVGFLDDLRDRSQARGERSTLLVLGDLLSFGKLPAGRELETAARAHAAVFGALGRLLAAGVGLEIVVGNHDADLLRPEVQAQLCRLFGESVPDDHPGGRLRVHPWIFHVPGLVYAEHGQQHHDLNRMPQLLDPAAVACGERLPLPLGTQLAVSLFELEQARAVPSRSEGLASALRASSRFVERACRAVVAMQLASRRSPTAGELRPYAAELELPTEVLHALATLSSAGPPDVARRLLSRRPPGQYMVEAAAAVHRLLLRFGKPARFYLFGHTHIACDVTLDSAAAPARYLSAGTWSSLRPPAAEPGGGRLPFVEIADVGRVAPAARLSCWDPNLRRSEPLGVVATPTAQTPGKPL